MLSFLNVCLIIARVSVALLPYLHKIWHTLTVRLILKSHQFRYLTPNIRI
jgi:hypothetical protein